VDYWHPLSEVIFFKRRVYREALTEFAPMLFPDGAPPVPASRRTPHRRRRRR
jgi:putative (di)nucleoside polyphosphate hydrolase